MNVAVATRLAPRAAQVLRDVTRETTSPVLAAHRQHAATRLVCDLHGIDVRVSGKKPEGPALFVANHLSYVDPIVLGALAPCVAIAKHDVAKWPIVGPRVRAVGVVFVNRACTWSRARALRAMLRALRLGTNVLNFPEGTTSAGPGVLPFYRGAFGVARIAGVPIVPVRIDYDDPRVAWTGKATFLPHYLALLSRGPARAFVTFGQPILPHLSRTARDLADEARAAIEDMQPHACAAAAEE